MSEKERVKGPVNSDQRFIRFFGGRKLIFSLAILIMLGILVMIYNQISFIFLPLRVIFSTIVAPLILAIVFFYILNPLVTFLEKRKLNRTLGTALVLGGFAVLVVWGIISVIPILVEQITGFVEAFPGYIDTLSGRFEEFVVGSQFESYYNEAVNNFDEIVGEIPQMIWNWVNNSSQRIFSVFSTISSVVVVLVTFPVILFFMLKERGKFKPFMMKLTPPIWRDDLDILGNRMADVLGSYIVGEALVALSLGGILLAGYLIIGLVCRPVGGVAVGVVVVAHLLAVELFGVCDAPTSGRQVERGGLVGVLAVAKGTRFGPGCARPQGETVATGGVGQHGSHPGGDGHVVGGGVDERCGCERPALLQRESPLRHGVQQLGVLVGGCDDGH